MTTAARYLLAGFMVFVFAAWMVTLADEGWKALKRLRFFLLLLLLCPVAKAQDSPAALDQRWRDAGTGPQTHIYHQIETERGLMPTAPYPGFWHCGTAGNFRYCPCYPLPYTTWVDPETLNTGLFRYDFSPMKQPQGCPGGIGTPPCLFASAGGPNHSLTWLDPTAVERPIQRQPSTPNYYPGPAGLCDVWLANNNNGTCPDPNYIAKIRSNPTWVTAYNYKKPVMDADPGCSGGTPPTPTKTPTPGPTLTPSKTPTPAPNIYARYIIWAYDQHIVVGCAPNLFCPGDPASANGLVTRGQLCVYEYKARLLTNPTEPLPPCRAVFTDVVCGAP